MSVQRGYGLNGKSLYTNVTMPTYTWVQFTVNAADAGGLGVKSVKSNGFVEHVFMHTSQTPGKVSGITNPNPAAGFCAIAFIGNFNYFLGMRAHLTAPAANTGTTSTTANTTYSITALGTATLAQWQAVGLPAGFTPAVGQAFVATASQSIGGSATVGTAGVPIITSVQVVGDPNATVSNLAIASNGGAQLLLQFCAATDSSTTTLTPTAPADGTVVRLELCYDRSSVTIDGL